MKKKIIIISLVILVLVLVLNSTLMMKKKTNDTNLEPEIKTVIYNCSKKVDWQEFEPSVVMGQYLGKYKVEYNIEFKVKDNEIYDKQYIATYNYENGFGYSYYGGDYEKDDETLTKKLILHDIPYDYEKNDLSSLINVLEVEAFKCIKK